MSKFLVPALALSLVLGGCGESPVEPVAVSGTEACVEITPIDDELDRYECDEEMSDQRVSGVSVVGVTEVDATVTPMYIAGTIVITNEGGVWEGTWTGSIAADGRHVVEGELIGTADYEGLAYRARWEYYDWPATVTGTIELAP